MNIHKFFISAVMAFFLVACLARPQILATDDHAEEDILISYRPSTTLHYGGPSASDSIFADGVTGILYAKLSIHRPSVTIISVSLWEAELIDTTDNDRIIFRYPLGRDSHEWPYIKSPSSIEIKQWLSDYCSRFEVENHYNELYSDTNWVIIPIRIPPIAEKMQIK